MLSQGFIKSLYLLSTRITRINQHTAMLKGLDPSDYQSTAGDSIFLGSKPITWIVKKRVTVSQSSTEGKYRSLASCTAELSGLCMICHYSGVFALTAPHIQCDNKSVLAFASNSMFHTRTKDILVDFHFVCKRVVQKDLEVKFISSNDQ